MAHSRAQEEPSDDADRQAWELVADGFERALSVPGLAAEEHARLMRCRRLVVPFAAPASRSSSSSRSSVSPWSAPRISLSASATTVDLVVKRLERELNLIELRPVGLAVEELLDGDRERGGDLVEVARVWHRLARLPPLPLAGRDPDAVSGLLLGEAVAFA